MKVKVMAGLLLFLVAGCATPLKAQTVVVEKVYIEKPVVKERIVYRTKYVPKVVYKWRTKVVYRCPSPKYSKKIIYKY